MAQQKIKINGKAIYQPDEDLTVDFETTYTGDSTRTQDGVGHFTGMFTVESFGYKATGIPVKDATPIIQAITGKEFTLYYFSPYYGAWREDRFNVGKGSFQLKTLKEGGETYESLSFNMVGVNPIA